MIVALAAPAGQLHRPTHTVTVTRQQNHSLCEYWRGVALVTVRRLFVLNTSYPEVTLVTLKQGRHQRSPAGLMAGSNPSTVVTMKVFIEQDVILPMTVGLEVVRASIKRAEPILLFIPLKQSNQTTS